MWYLKENGYVFRVVKKKFFDTLLQVLVGCKVLVLLILSDYRVKHIVNKI